MVSVGGLGRFIRGRRGKQTDEPQRHHLFPSPRVAGEKKQTDEPQPSGVEFITHVFTLREGVQVQFPLPKDLTEREASRLSKFVETLPFGTEAHLAN